MRYQPGSAHPGMQPHQATQAIEYANLKGDEILLDLYCGIGTIGIFASSKVSKVYGIEIVEQAIEDAKANGILESADENAKTLIEGLIKSNNEYKEYKVNYEYIGG